MYSVEVDPRFTIELAVYWKPIKINIRWKTHPFYILHVYIWSAVWFSLLNIYIKHNIEYCSMNLCFFFIADFEIAHIAISINESY